MEVRGSPGLGGGIQGPQRALGFSVYFSFKCLCLQEDTEG